MQRDLGSRDPAFCQVTLDIRDRIRELAGAGPEYSVVPVQGSGTFAIEAALTTFLKEGGKVLVCANGVYCETAAKILRRHGLPHAVLSRPVTEPVPAAEAEAALEADRGVTHLYFVHCETTSGILNPMPELLALARRHGVVSIVDSMSAFGAAHTDARAHPFDVLVSPGNKCLEAPPGIAFPMVRRALLTPQTTAARTCALDLFGQWRAFAETGEWRSTSPTHVAQALHAAHAGLREETVAGRRARYAAIRDRLVAGMRPLGFEPVVPPHLQSPICVAFRSDALVPDAAAFANYCRHLRAARRLIYARFHEGSRSFRVGCIGRIEPGWVDELIEATRAFAQPRRRPRGGGAGVQRRQAAAPDGAAAVSAGPARALPPAEQEQPRPANDAARQGTESLARGQADAVAEGDMMPLDWAALVPMAEGAGGRVTGWDGRPLGPDGSGRVRATPPRRHAGRLHGRSKRAMTRSRETSPPEGKGAATASSARRPPLRVQGRRPARPRFHRLRAGCGTARSRPLNWPLEPFAAHLDLSMER